MKTTSELITPELAQKYFDGRRSNRPIMWKTVERYARMIKEGKWQETHQGIAFDEHGQNIDGQHRLLAIVNAGVPVRMNVTRGVSGETYQNIDAGQSKAPYDRFTLIDGAYALNRAAVLIAHAYSGCAVSRLGRSSGAEILFVGWDKMGPAIQRVAERWSSRRIAKITSAPVGAAIACYIDVHPSNGQEFMDGLVSGADLPERSPCLILRSALLADRITSRMEAYWKTISATQAHFERRTPPTFQAAAADWHGNVYVRQALARSRAAIKAAEMRKANRARGEDAA